MTEELRAKPLEEKRAELLIKYRRLNVDRVEGGEDKTVYYLSKGDERYVMLCVLGEKNIGVSYIRKLKELVDREGATRGIMVVGGVYTYSSRSFAEKWGIELIEPSLPTFDVFEHELVPRHEILSEEERQKVLDRFHAKSYQFPWIKASDPISIILGAKPGDIIKIMGKSLTAGVYESYRYVVK